MYFDADTGSLDITGGGTSTVASFNLSRFGVLGDSQCLRFDGDNGLAETYYPAVVSMLSRMELVTCFMNLNAVDLDNIRLAYPVFLNDSLGNIALSGYYLINLIKEYRDGRLAEVELVKLNP